MPISSLRIAVVLGVLSAVGPLAIDMYLPALPSIGQSLATSMTAVQMSLLVYFLSLGIGQVIYGPLSDQIGRKPPMYFGLVEVLKTALKGYGGIMTLLPVIYTINREERGIGTLSELSLKAPVN